MERAIENLCEDKNIRADCKTAEENLDSYNLPNKPFLQGWFMNTMFARIEGTSSEESSVQLVKP